MIFLQQMHFSCIFAFFYFAKMHFSTAFINVMLILTFTNNFFF